MWYHGDHLGSEIPSPVEPPQVISDGVRSHPGILGSWMDQGLVCLVLLVRGKSTQLMHAPSYAKLRTPMHIWYSPLCYWVRPHTTNLLIGCSMGSWVHVLLGALFESSLGDVRTIARSVLHLVGLVVQWLCCVWSAARRMRSPCVSGCYLCP